MGFRPAGLQEYERLQHSRCCAIRDPRWWWCPFNMALKWVLGRPLESHKSHEGENHQMGSNSRITTVHNEGCLPLHMLLKIPWAENSFDHSPQTSELQIKIKGCPKYYVRRVTRDRVIWRLWNYVLRLSWKIENLSNVRFIRIYFRRTDVYIPTSIRL